MPPPHSPGSMVPLVTVDPYEFLSTLTYEQSIDLMTAAFVFVIAGAVLIQHEMFAAFLAGLKRSFRTLLLRQNAREWK